MTIRVFDFYSRDRVSVVRRGNFLMNNATFYILVKKDGEIKELSVSIPKRYHFVNSYDTEEFRADKRDEYNILIDFIKYNKESLCNKWEFSELDFTSLTEGLEIAFINLYSKHGFLIKCLLKAWIVFKYFCRGLKS